MKIEVTDKGVAHHRHTDRMVDIACKTLVDYFSDGCWRQPSDLEDDFCGQPHLGEFVLSLTCMPRWGESPFFPALARLVKQGKIVYETAEDEQVYYAAPGCLPSQGGKPYEREY